MIFVFMSFRSLTPDDYHLFTIVYMLIMKLYNVEEINEDFVEVLLAEEGIVF